MLRWQLETERRGFMLPATACSEAMCVKASTHCDDTETPRHDGSDMQSADDAMQDVCTSLAVIGPAANLSEARTTATDGTLLQQERPVTAVDANGRLQRKPATRINDDEDTIRLLGIEVTYAEHPGGQHRHCRTWKKLQQTGAIARRCFTASNSDLTVTTMGLNQCVTPALKTRAVATLPTPSWVQKCIDSPNSEMLMRSAGVGQQSTATEMQRHTDMLMLARRARKCMPAHRQQDAREAVRT